MQNFQTSDCYKYGHPEISVPIDDECALSPSWLISFFEDEVRRGRRFEVDQTVQIGWGLTKVMRGKDSEALEIWEPSYDSMPIDWVPGVTHTLRQLVLQKSICKDLEVEPCFPCLTDAGVVSRNFSGSIERFTMSRDEDEQNDSGWVFASETNVAEQAEFKSLYELSLVKPTIIPFLALPPGGTVVIAPGQIEVAFGDRKLSSDSNRLLGGIVRSNLFE